MRIKVDDLRATAEILFSYLEATGQGEVTIPHDFYWNVPTEGRYDSYEEPTELDVGQLTEDWDRLQNIRQGQSPPVAYALVWLAAVLRAVGEQTQG